MVDEKYIAAIDLGTSKFALAVAKVKGEDVQVVYYREHEADGIRSSVLSNPKRASLPLGNAIREAEEELLIKILQVVVGLPRYSVREEMATGSIERTDPDDYISEEEVETLKSMALESYPLDDVNNQIIYGAVAQSFSTDDEIQQVEKEVVGALSSTLEGNFKIFIGNRRATTAVDKIFNTLGVAIAKKYFLPDVAARCVLSEEERQNGVALIDFGAGVTSVAIYYGGIMRHYAAIPFGGRTITNDIRTECSISEHLAENLKLAYGACLPGKLANLSEKIIQVRYEDAPFKEIPVKYLSEVIDARAREIIDAILYSIQESGMQKLLRSGVVLTGGGASLANLKGLISDMSGYNVRIGTPRRLVVASGCNGASSPAATSVIGMLYCAKDDNLPECVEAPKEIEKPKVELTEEVLEEVPVVQMSDEDYLHGETGNLPGFEQPQPKKQKKKVRVQTSGGKSFFWNKVTRAMDNVYKTITDDKI